jgi:hypothetical protein
VTRGRRRERRGDEEERAKESKSKSESKSEKAEGKMQQQELQMVMERMITTMEDKERTEAGPLRGVLQVLKYCSSKQNRPEAACAHISTANYWLKGREREGS